jgi:hypothetical protein
MDPWNSAKTSVARGSVPERNCPCRGLPPAEGLDTVDANQAAAVMAALSLWLEEDQLAHASDGTNESSWTRAAKLESQGIAVGPATLRSGWRL